MSKTLFLTLASALIISVGVVWKLADDNKPGQTPPSIPLTQLIGGDDEGFARGEGSWPFTFPQDHGAHPEFRTESWYFTGQLTGPDERRFGFQLSFFRLALTPQPPLSTSAWATNQIYRGHFALTDVDSERFEAHERFSRAALGLSGADGLPVRVWLEDWSIEANHDTQDPARFRLRAVENDTLIELELQAAKPPVLSGTGNGIPGVPESGGTFHYYLLPRLHARGTLTLGTDTSAVDGIAWLNRAWGAAPVSQGQIALNRFTLQLDNGLELAVSQLHRRDGSGKPVSTGLLIVEDGSAYPLGRRDLSLETLDHWTSPKDQARYPGRWRLVVPGEQLELEIAPYLPDQELDLSVRYWAGMVSVSGTAAGAAVGGDGYVELTGYADSGIRL